MFRMKNKNVSHIPCAFTDNNIELPILDITHPYFISSIDETVFRTKCAYAAKKATSTAKMPVIIKYIIKRISNVDDAYLSGIRTLILKLGPDLLQGRKINFLDKFLSKQYTSIALRIRLKEICGFQAIYLIQKLKESPKRNICFINIAGGASSDSINTLILIQEEAPEVLKGRKIEINILDIDSFGPNFAQKCIDVLKSPGERFCGLDITFRIIPYNWNNSEDLLMATKERSEWIQICSSEGGLFEYGSDEDIIKNLNQLYINSASDIRITDSLVFDKENVNPGYHASAEITGINIRFIGLTGLNRLLSQTKWYLENIKEIDSIFIVFTLRKSEDK